MLLTGYDFISLMVWQSVLIEVQFKKVEVCTFIFIEDLLIMVVQRQLATLYMCQHAIITLAGRCGLSQVDVLNPIINVETFTRRKSAKNLMYIPY